MFFLYNIGIAAFRAGIFLASPFNKKARLWQQGRRKFFKKHSSKLKELANQELAWFHCASLGEFEQGKPLIEAFKLQYPTFKILITFFSPSGYEVRKDYDQADLITYLPLDTISNATKFISLCEPKVAFFVKYEFWYHYLNQLKIHGALAFSVSAAFRSAQFRNNSSSALLTKILRKFDHIFVQNEYSMKLLKLEGFENITLSNDTRFDRTLSQTTQDNSIEKLDTFCNAEMKTLILGSVWKSDMKVILPVLKKLTTPIKIVVAPHEIHEDEIKSWATEIGKTHALYSDGVDAIKSADVLFINNVGLLSKIYSYGSIAYVGGAFEKGLHNILEPAAFGLPVIFGPKTDKYPEAEIITDCKGGTQVKNTMEFYEALTSLLDDETKYNEFSTNAAKFVSDRIGATDKIMDHLKMKLYEGTGY